MRPAYPVSCEPFDVIVPVYNELPSVNNGSWVLPLASDEAVVGTEAVLTAVAPVPESTRRKGDPEGFEHCRMAPPRARFSSETTDDNAPAKLPPINWLLRAEPP